MTFMEVCQECLSNKALVEQWNRLTGNKLNVARTPIEAAIDKACGYDPDKEAMPEFEDFVYKYVWWPLVKEAHVEVL